MTYSNTYTEVRLMQGQNTMEACTSYGDAVCSQSVNNKM